MKPRNLVKLTPQQKECVQYLSDQTLLVRGIPGSGKTTVLLERATFLESVGERASSDVKILVLTYNATLATYIRQLTLESGDNQVEATTFHSWGLKILADLGITSKGGAVKGKIRDTLIGNALSIVKRKQPYLKPPTIAPKKESASGPEGIDQEIVDFLGDEFSWIKGWGKTRERYMTEPRTGRGSSIHVTKENREWIWVVYEAYQAKLERMEVFDFDDVARLLNLHEKRIPEQKRPIHVLVDEAQDLTPLQLQVINKLKRRSLTIAADMGQSLYPRGFTWKQVGIDIRGRSKALSKSFRSTRQIIRLANSLQRWDPIVLKKDEEFVPATEPDVDGPVPDLYLASDLAAQVTQVVAWVADRRRSFSEDTVAIIVPTKRLRKRYEAELDRLGIPWIDLKAERGADAVSPGVKLSTQYSAKGLEFDHVAVTGLKDGTVPLHPSKEASREDREEFLATERRKVYVAMTRAKLALALFASPPLSQFVAELDAKLYRRV